MKGPLGNIMKQAQEMQEKLKAAQESLASMEVTGASGGGMVEVVMTCRYDVRRVSIDDALANDDKEVLEDKNTSIAPIGEGLLDWDHLIPACEKAGVVWYAVEQDQCRRDAFDCLKSSYEYLTSKGV